MKKIIADYNLKELENFVLSLGEKQFRAKQIYSGVMRGHNISDIPALPAALKERLLTEFENCALEIIKTLRSADGTEKYLYKLADGNIIEGVLMKYKYGNTLCVSTQVGCRMGCKFCASTLGGLVRNLSSGEILSQVLKVNALHGGTESRRAVTNVVLMGSGEPLDNYANVIKFIRDMAAEGGINISPRNVSLSTCGLVPQLRKFMREAPHVTLSVSLHAPNDAIRSMLMPVNAAYPVAELLAAAKEYAEYTGRRVIFEYALIQNMNRARKHAQELASRLRGINCHVNLIPLNHVEERSLMGVTRQEAEAFMGWLSELGISATIRREMGTDIEGACGQLRRRVLEARREENR